MPRYRLLIDGGAVVELFEAAGEFPARRVARRLAAQALAVRDYRTRGEGARLMFVLQQQQVEGHSWRFVLGWVSRL